MTQLIAVKHNVEMAHRLSQTPGKCEQIHGHSWQVTLKLIGETNSSGMVREFGDVKRVFRNYLDTTFDHHLLLYTEDPIIKKKEDTNNEVWMDVIRSFYPGLQLFAWDPTTENFAAHLYDWSVGTFDMKTEVEVWETAVNMARAGGPW